MVAPSVPLSAKYNPVEKANHSITRREIILANGV
jgi:hypothetical protein